jgi:hypothetical protein
VSGAPRWSPQRLSLHGRWTRGEGVGQASAEKKILWKLYPHLRHVYMRGCLTCVGLYGACGRATDRRGRVNDPD